MPSYTIIKPAHLFIQWPSNIYKQIQPTIIIKCPSSILSKSKNNKTSTSGKMACKARTNSYSSLASVY